MPLYSIDKIKGNGFMAIWEITENEAELTALGSVPEDEMVYISQLPSQSRRIEKLAARVLIDMCFEKKQYIGYEENNRPYLKNYSGDISISHAGRFVCILVHESKYVGIDIESRKRNFKAVENKILSPYEMSYLDQDNKTDQLCIIWSAKETIYKAMHQQKVEFNTQIELNKFTPKQEGRIVASFWSEDFPKTEFKVFYRLIEEFALTWMLR